jgi:NAD(P)-dependent dehydrogenase (short-subunit alcohol dehydrogenase family)
MTEQDMRRQGFPAQSQEQPGREYRMHPAPESWMEHYKAAGKLEGKAALITGGDSGIGRAVTIAFAKEGADVAIVYLKEHEDARLTAEYVEKRLGRRCLLIPGDIRDRKFCREAVQATAQWLGGLDILVNNAGEQHPHDDIADISARDLSRTFETNIFAMFYLVQAALPFLHPGSVIINTASVTAYRGSEHLIDYSATKGAIVSFTRSLSKNLVKQGVRVNAVAPGPIWTPLIPASFDKKHVRHFGEDTPMERAGQPDEVAPSYVFLASEDSSFMTGQVLHPNGGEIINV